MTSVLTTPTPSTRRAGARASEVPSALIGGRGPKLRTAVPTSGASASAGSPATTAEDRHRLFERWQQQGDRLAREALVHQFMPLTRSLARRYGRSSEPFEDLLQVASLGLLKALDRFDPSRGHPFQSFAVPTILGEMRRYFRDSGWSVHVPRAAQERALTVRSAQQRLTGERGRAPTVNQLAQYLELDIEDIIDGLQATEAYETLSLDAPRRGVEEELTVTYWDTLGEEDERYELVELAATLTSALRHLPQRERLILRLRFVEELTQTQIATRVGISQMQVSRLLRRSIDRLRMLARATTEAPRG
jgi:RNA polymerase sigma-B factor